jgi:hypothetical protein
VTKHCAGAWRYAFMPHYTEQELERCERLVAELRNQVVRQQTLVDQLTNFRALDLARSLLEHMTETLALFEQKRVRLLKALTE